MDDKAFERLAKLMLQQYDMFSKRVSQMEEHMTNLANKTYERMDAVFKEVVDMRVEQAAHIGSHDRVDEKLEVHGEQLKRLESKSAVV